jgi:hypothetical protein
VVIVDSWVLELPEEEENGRRPVYRFVNVIVSSGV